MPVPILRPEQHWVCPNCTWTDITHDSRPHSRMHNCAGRSGISAPMVAEGLKCKVEVREREDYVGDEHPQYDGEGRPIMSVVTTREDGEDCAVLAPVAVAKLTAE